MKLEVMKKEEALLEELSKVSLEKERKEKENQKLREQLQEIKDKMEKVKTNYLRIFCSGCYNLELSSANIAKFFLIIYKLK
jgi:hypothetical protein